MIWFTADEHYGHYNIIKFCNRPFKDLHHMHMVLQTRFNNLVSPEDHTYHLGDFSLDTYPKRVQTNYIQQLNGTHSFIIGSHDKWLKNTDAPYLIEKMFNGIYIALCHYAMLTWPRSHHGSLQLFAHSHGSLDNQLPRPYNRHSQKDIGVDTNKFYPYSLDEILNELKGEKDGIHEKGRR